MRLVTIAATVTLNVSIGLVVMIAYVFLDLSVMMGLTNVMTLTNAPPKFIFVVLVLSAIIVKEVLIVVVKLDIPGEDQGTNLTVL